MDRSRIENAVFYQIYPQSFYDSNGDGIGDLNGITEKLDYIADLGCTGIWINPCFESPFYDAGYDVADYRKVAPRYGTNEDLENLFREAHKRGILVLLDLVPGHTSYQHPWFRESSKAEKNEYTDRYAWTDSVWNSPEGYGCIRGFSERDGACVTNFFTHQPALNYGFAERKENWQQGTEDPGPVATRNEIIDIMRFWLGKGCDGFRVDMAGSLVKNDPGQRETIKLWQKIHGEIRKEYPDCLTVSEWGEPDKALKAGFSMDFLLHFGPSHYNDLFRCEHPYFMGEGDAKAFVERYQESREKEKDGLICIPSGNHDMDRLARHIHGENLKLAFAFLLSMPGIPYIYYGDEIGMRHVEGLASKEGGYGRTGARTPMQWNKEKNKGFSAADKTYLPVDTGADAPDVAGLEGIENSLPEEVRRLIRVRKAHPALRAGGEIEWIREDGVLMYLRRAEGEKILIAINPGKEAAEIETDVELGEAVYAFGGAGAVGRTVKLPPVSFVLVSVK